MQADFESGRSELRRLQRQARSALGVAQPIGDDDGLQRALAYAVAREQNYVEDDGWLISEGFRYEPRLERLRWARTRDILQRTAPGPDEDPRYLEMIARQAAAIEMVLRGEYSDTPDARLAGVCDRVLLGTVPTIDPGAYASGVDKWLFVLICAGLIEFLYQAAKAAVLSLPSAQPAAGAAVAFGIDADAIDAALAASPVPVYLLRATLNAYIFDGMPRAFGPQRVPAAHHLPLKVLINSSERFVLAHEYVHTLHEAYDIAYPGGTPEQEEAAADMLAFHLTLRSASDLDLVAPNLAAQGPFFVLTALDVLRRTLHLVRYGDVRGDDGLSGHPPLARRQAILQQLYLTKVSDRDDDLSIRPSLAPGQVLSVLWQRAIAQDPAPWRDGRQPHRMWDGIWAA